MTKLFTLTLIVAVLATASFASISQPELLDLWEEWKGRYNVVYEDQQEDAHRLSVFLENFEIVKNLNADPEQHASFTLNKFANLTLAEFSTNVVKRNPIVSDLEIELSDDAEEYSTDFDGPEEDIPTSFDWRTKNAVSKPLNEGECGATWAFTAVSIAEAVYVITGNKLTLFSIEQVVACDTANDGCEGGWPYRALNYIAKNGLMTDAEYPYNFHDLKCGYNKSEAIKTGVTGGKVATAVKNPSKLKGMIYQAPVSLLVDASQSVFQFYEKGVITKGCSALIDQSLTGFGYGTAYGPDAFYAKNQWGTNWGDNGYVYISTSSMPNGGLGECGILSHQNVATFSK